MNKILICIPTFYRNKSLIECLNSIKKLENINLFDIRILILDNTISNNSFNIIKKYKANTKLKILQKNEKKRGIVNARNKCLKISKSIKPKYIAFIDDDCTVDKNWLKNIFKLLKKVNADIITGPQKYQQNNRIIKNNYSILFEKNYKKSVVKVKWAATNNVFFSYDIIKNKKIIFDKLLNKFGMGEDQLFFSILGNKGHKIYWSQNIKVYEKDHKHRNNIYWLIKRSFRLGVLGHYIDKKLHGNFYGYLNNYLKSSFFLFCTIRYIPTLYDKNSRIFALNFLFRFLGKFFGPIIFKKIDFLQNDNK